MDRSGLVIRGRVDKTQRCVPGRESSRAEVAGSALFEQHGHRVYRYLERAVGRNDAEDALQETYLLACRSLGRGVRPTAPLAWLLTIARNHAISRSRAARPVVSLEEVGELPAAPDPPRMELLGLSAALAALPETQRRALVLREWCGLTYEEIGEELSLSYSAVAAHVFRGRNAVAARLAHEPPVRSRPGMRSAAG